MKSFTVANVRRLETMPGFKALMANNGRLAKGDVTENRTPFFGDRETENVMMEGLNAVHGSIFDDLEKVEFDKAGPFKRSPYFDYSGNLHNYFMPLSKAGDSASTETLARVADDVTGYLRSRMVSVAIQSSLDEAYKRSRKNTNLGLPYLTNKWDSKVISDYLGRAKALLEGRNVMVAPFTLFHRSQPRSRTEWKDRVVWGSDHAETFAGLTVLGPVLSMLREIQGFEAWRGMDAVEVRAAQIFAVNGIYVSTDFSGFDSTIHPGLMQSAFRVIDGLFDFKLEPAFLRRMFEYYTTGEIVTPEGILQGLHGLPSGVTWTNLIGTLLQIILLRLSTLEMGVDLEKVDFMFLGDDGVVRFENESQARIHFEVCERYGLEVNESKSDMSDDSFSFLQRHFRKSLSSGNFCPGVYSVVRTLGRLLWTERGGFKIDDEVLRENFVNYDAGFWILVAYMKLENCKRHPKFREIVEIAVKGDKFGLDPAKVGARINYVSSIKGYDTSDATPRTSGLESFESVRTAVEIRARLGLN